MPVQPPEKLEGTPFPRRVIMLKKVAQWPLHVFESAEHVLAHIERNPGEWQIFEVTLSEPLELEVEPPRKAILKEKPQKPLYSDAIPVPLDAGSSGAVRIVTDSDIAAALPGSLFKGGGNLAGRQAEPLPEKTE